MPADLLVLVALGVAAGSAAVAVLALVVAGRAVARARRLERGRALRSVPGSDPSVGDLRTEMAQLRADLGTALRHVAVVRYDAFGDLAGRLSFSAALLDDAGDGVVVTSINGRSDTRTYAKGVSGGTSPHPLSPEEQEAVARARRPEPALHRAG